VVINNYDRDRKAIREKKLVIIERNIKEKKDYIKQAETAMAKIQIEVEEADTARIAAAKRYEDAESYWGELNDSINESREYLEKAEAELDDLKKKLSEK